MTKRYLAAGIVILFAFNQGAQAYERGVASQKHENHQKHRIGSGVKSGKLTHHETKRLGREQHRISHYKGKATSDGKVTKREKHHLNKMQKHANRDIHRQKHDAQERGNHRGKEPVDSAAVDLNSAAVGAPTGNQEDTSAEQALRNE